MLSARGAWQLSLCQLHFFLSFTGMLWNGTHSGKWQVLMRLMSTWMTVMDKVCCYLNKKTARCWTNTIDV